MGTFRVIGCIVCPGTVWLASTRVGSCIVCTGTVRIAFALVHRIIFIIWAFTSIAEFAWNTVIAKGSKGKPRAAVALIV
jgi:hypothetical protein